MSSAFSCNGCGRLFRWHADRAGRRARCRCGAVLQIPAEDPAGLRPAEEDPAPRAEPAHDPADTRYPAQHAEPPPRDWTLDPRFRRAAERGRAQRFETSRLRMGLLQIGLGCQIARMLLLAGLVALLLGAGVFQIPMHGAGWRWLFAGLPWLNTALGIAGFLLMYATPHEARGGGFFLEASAICFSLSAVLGGGWMPGIPSGPGGEIAAGVMRWLSYAMFLMFFRALAGYLGFDAITDRASRLVKLFVALAVLALLMPLLPCIGPLLMLGLLAYAAGLYVLTIVDLFNAVNHRWVRA